MQYVLMCISVLSINNLNSCMYIASTFCALPLQPYRDITSVLFCRLVNVDILLLFLTIFIRYKTEMNIPQFVDAPVQIIYRSYRYKY